MIRQYIKLFLESNRDTEDNSSSFNDLLNSMINPNTVSQEDTDQSIEDNSNSSRQSRTNDVNTTIHNDQHRKNSNEYELFMRRRTNRDRNN